MEVLIDTSFILGCLDKKIPLFDDLEDMGLKVLIPDQVVGELKKLTENKTKSYSERDRAELAIQLIKHKKPKKVNLNKVYVDAGIQNFIEKNNQVYVATLDKELRRRLVGAKFVIIRGRTLEVNWGLLF